MFDDFERMDSKDLASGYDAGYSFTTVCVNPAIYLPWLLGQCLKNGVVFKRVFLFDIDQARSLSRTGRPADMIINCTGLGSLHLGGVTDPQMIPARGQTVLLRNESRHMLMFSETNEGPPEEMYLMTRACGGGTVLGGTYELGNWDPNPDLNQATRMMKRIVESYPQIANNSQGIAGLEVIRHGVGFRPHRTTGVRVERDRTRSDVVLVHNYGHDSWGYMGSYGCAERVVELCDQAAAAASQASDDDPRRPRRGPQEFPTRPRL
jgi:D-amino-acid oxidase